MNPTMLSPHPVEDNQPNQRALKTRFGNQPQILSHIYDDDINLAVWQRTLSKHLTNSVQDFILTHPHFEKSLTLSPDNAYTELQTATFNELPKPLMENIAEVVDMFGFLFDLRQVGVRIATLNQAMCPRFHVDKVPCRLVTTYYGAATQWLPNHSIDRSKLGSGSKGQPDSLSGLYQSNTDIKHLNCGDVALLKGENWLGNEGGGLVHRSPQVDSQQTRLLLTLDFRD